MGLKSKLGKLQKAMRGTLEYFELADGSRYYFDPHESFSTTFRYFADSLRVEHKREPRPEPPEVLQAVAEASDRGAALDRVMDNFSHLPLDREALVERGELVARSLRRASQQTDEEDLSEMNEKGS
jgi:hypothetical protein